MEYFFKVCDYVKENGTYDGEDEEDEYDEHGHRCAFQQQRNVSIFLYDSGI